MKSPKDINLTPNTIIRKIFENKIEYFAVNEIAYCIRVNGFIDSTSSIRKYMHCESFVGAMPENRQNLTVKLSNKF